MIFYIIKILLILAGAVWCASTLIVSCFKFGEWLSLIQSLDGRVEVLELEVRGMRRDLYQLVDGKEK